MKMKWATTIQLKAECLSFSCRWLWNHGLFVMDVNSRLLMRWTWQLGKRQKNVNAPYQLNLIFVFQASWGAVIYTLLQPGEKWHSWNWGEFPLYFPILEKHKSTPPEHFILPITMGNIFFSWEIFLNHLQVSWKCSVVKNSIVIESHRTSSGYKGCLCH